MISLEQKLEIRKLYQASYTNRQISTQLDIHIHTVRKWVGIIKKRIIVFYDGTPPIGIPIKL